MTTPAETEHFEQILRYLEQTRGFDFSAYKRTTLMRRVLKRMQSINVTAFDEYLDYLQVHQEEFSALFNTILINVTSFLRDPEVWAILRDEIIPTILAAKKDDGPIRVWSAGCASGQEPYSLAMLFAEAVGVDALRERVKIYATDADEEALAEARSATYTERQVSDVPEHLAAKYFDVVNGAWVVNRDLRRAVICGRHDLLQDAPISKIDLLLCRNTLMYFNSEAQGRIVQRFYFSLNPSGYAVLGRAEMLFAHATTFTPVDLKRRVFRTVPKASDRDRLLLMPQSGRDNPQPQPPGVRLRELAFEHDSIAQLVLDAEGALSAANAPARHNFHITHRDLGRPFQDLEVSYRPAEIRGALDRAVQQRGQVRLSDVPWTVSGSLRHFDVLVCPVFEDGSVLLGVTVSFHDITDMRTLQIELRHTKQELNSANAFLQSVFTGLGSAVVALDRDLRVKIWNDRAMDLWGLRADETELSHFLGLDIGLPVNKLREPIREVMNGSQERALSILPATSRRGRAVQCRVSVIPLLGVDRTPAGVILFMEEDTAENTA